MTEEQKRDEAYAEAAQKGYLKVKNTISGRKIAAGYPAECERLNWPVVLVTQYVSRSDISIDLDPLPGEIEFDTTLQRELSDYTRTVRAEAAKREFTQAHFPDRTTMQVHRVPITHDDLLARELCKILFNAKGIELPEGVK